MTSEEATIDVAGRQAALKAKGLMGDDSVAKSYSDQLGEQLKASLELVDAKTPYDEGGPFNLDTIAKQRKPRKDKGTHRVKAPAIAQQPGFLSASQASRLNDLILKAEGCLREYELAVDNIKRLRERRDSAIWERDDFIDDLAGKGRK